MVKRLERIIVVIGNSPPHDEVAIFVCNYNRINNYLFFLILNRTSLYMQNGPWENMFPFWKHTCLCQLLLNCPTIFNIYGFFGRLICLPIANSRKTVCITVCLLFHNCSFVLLNKTLNIEAFESKENIHIQIVHTTIIL